MFVTIRMRLVCVVRVLLAVTVKNVLNGGDVMYEDILLTFCGAMGLLVWIEVVKIRRAMKKQ